ncbi:recombinase family protein [Streptomyces narbonensis]
MRAAVHLRLSRDREGSTSIASQREDCRSLCRSHGWPVVAEEVDLDTSGSRPVGGRPGLRKLLDDPHRFDVLVIAQADRLSRSVVVALDLRGLSRHPARCMRRAAPVGDRGAGRSARRDAWTGGGRGTERARIPIVSPRTNPIGPRRAADMGPDRHVRPRGMGFPGHRRKATDSPRSRRTCRRAPGTQPAALESWQATHLIRRLSTPTPGATSARHARHLGRHRGA